jgi:hypothetical protein
MVHPPSLGLLTICYILKHTLPLHFSWSLGRIACCNIDICNTLCNCGIKEDFGGQIGGLSKCVDAYVYEVILFYFSCFCIVVDLAL